MDLADLGTVADVTLSPGRIVLDGRGDSQVIRARAHSAAGFTARLGARDAICDVDPRLLDVDAAPDGWRVTARVDSAATSIDVIVDDRRVTVAVAIGAHPRVLTGPHTRWRLRTVRATARLRPADERTGSTRVALEYDFTRSTATRTVHADLTAPVPIPGQPVALELWIDSDGNGAWPSLDCRDAEGTRIVLRGDHLTWHGPRRCRMPVPAAVVYPLSLHGCYLAETRPSHRYHGRARVGDITALVPPTDAPATMVTDLPFPVWFPPDEPPAPDTSPDRPLFTAEPPAPEDGTPALPAGGDSTGPLFTDDVSTRAWRFAVVSDTQFVAAGPDTLVTAARTTLRDIAAHRPDLVIVNGDFVDEGSPADLALARRILDTELADGPPWHYLPGNHEIAGGDIATFTGFFGEPRRRFDHRGVRFLTLDTSSLTIGEQQLAWLRDALDHAAGDDTVEAVVVAGHVPPHDPTGHDASRLTDRREAAALEAALASLAATGKGCAYLAGHAGVFAGWLRDGVTYLVNGNSGKEPAAPPARGGILGWSECGIDPVRSPRDRTALVQHRPAWLAVRVRRPTAG